MGLEAEVGAAGLRILGGTAAGVAVNMGAPQHWYQWLLPTHSPERATGSGKGNDALDALSTPSQKILAGPLVALVEARDCTTATCVHVLTGKAGELTDKPWALLPW